MKNIVYFLTGVFLIKYVSCVMFGSIVINLPHYIWLFVYIGLYVFYLRKYRKENLICFETFFLLISGLTYFFNVIVDTTIGSDVIFIGQGRFSALEKDRALSLEMLVTCFFYIGCFISNHKEKMPTVTYDKFEQIDLKKATLLSSTVAFLYFIFLLASGAVNKWFYYSNSSYSNDDAWRVFNMLTYLIDVATIFQFSYLYKQGTASLGQFVRNCNKFYLVTLLVVSFLLVISGNRGEMLMVFVPLIAMYSIMIKQIRGLILISFVAVGWGVMTIMGLVRAGDVEGNLSVSLFEGIRDYAPAYSNTLLLIDYTDTHGTQTLGDFILSLSSAIPFVGGFIRDLFSIQQSAPTTDITTEEFLGANASTNLGTSLVGDLYYQGKALFSCVYFLIMGWIVSVTYNKIQTERSLSIFALGIYVVLVSAAVYYPRAPWPYPIRFIGFCILFAWFISFMCNKRK